MANCPICGKDMAQTGSMGIMYRAKATGKRTTIYVCPDCGQLCGEVEFGNAKAYETLSNMKENISDKTILDYVESILKESEDFRNGKFNLPEKKEKANDEYASVLVTSENGFEGYKITEYKNVISGEFVFTSELFKNGSAETADVVNAEFSVKMYEAKQKALTNMKKRCSELGCNAIIGIDYNCIMLSSSMVGVSANGTAVKIEKI